MDENPAITNVQRKQMLEERKRELHQQQKGNEEEHQNILRTMAEHDTVEFKQRLLQERHSFQKALLHEVSSICTVQVSERLSM